MKNGIMTDNKGTTVINNEISSQLIFDSVYSFVSRLPYSMDPENEDYMPADLYNHNLLATKLLKNSCSNLKISSLFLELQSWRDTRRSSYVIQLCYVFQTMLRGNINSYIEDNEVNVWGVSEEYQEIINDI